MQETLGSKANWNRPMELTSKCAVDDILLVNKSGGQGTITIKL